jgi:hypothetical protein
MPTTASSSPLRKAVASTHPLWWSAELRGASAAWQMTHWEEAVGCGDISASDPEIGDALGEGWPDDAPGLARAAAWVCEAVWPRGSAGRSLSPEEVRRARQIGTAVLGPAPVEASAVEVAGAMWQVAAFFAPRERALIRLQVPPVASSSPLADERLNSASVVKVERLIGYARASVQARSGTAHV